jgi:hypothetical protein
MTAFRTWPAVLLCDPRHGVSLLTDGRAVLKMFNITIAYKGQVGLPLNIWGWLVRRYIFWLWTVAVCIYKFSVRMKSRTTTHSVGNIQTFHLRHISDLSIASGLLSTVSPPKELLERHNTTQSSIPQQLSVLRNNSSGKFSCYLCSSYPHSLTARWFAILYVRMISEQV